MRIPIIIMGTNFGHKFYKNVICFAKNVDVRVY